jgi:hypothetical protein
MNGNRPVKTFRLGHMSASVFQNEIENADKTKRILHGVQLQKRYRDDEGNWKTSTALNLPDLPLAQRVLELAQHFLEEHEAHSNS